MTWWTFYMIWVFPYLLSFPRLQQGPRSSVKVIHDLDLATIYHYLMYLVKWSQTQRSRLTLTLDLGPWYHLNSETVIDTEKGKPQTIFSMSGCSFAMSWPKWSDHSLRGISPINDSDDYIYSYNLLTVETYMFLESGDKELSNGTFIRPKMTFLTSRSNVKEPKVAFWSK